MPKSRVPVVSQSLVPKGAQVSQKKKAKKSKSGKMGSSHPPHVQLNIRPWTASVEGAGRPDMNSHPTLVWREVLAATYTTNADGNLWFSLLANLNSPAGVRTMTAGTTVLASGAAGPAFPNVTELSTTFNTVRPMILAFELEYVGEAQLQKGLFAAACVPSPSVVGTNFADYVDEPSYRECMSGQKIAGVLRYVDNTFGVWNAADASRNFEVAALGLPANTACVRIRVCMVVEATIGHTKLLSHELVHTIAHPAQVATVASLVGLSNMIATGANPIDKLAAHADSTAKLAGSAVGLYQASKPLLAILGEFASLVV